MSRRAVSHQVMAPIPYDTVRARNKQETQRETCDAEREPQKHRKRINRVPCVRKAFCTRLGYLESIIGAFRGHGFHALRLLFSSLLLAFPMYFELKR